MTFIGLVSGILITGPLADRWGAKRFAMLGNLLVARRAGCARLCRQLCRSAGCRALMGFGAGVLDMVLSPIVCALQPHRRTSAMNWLHSFYCFGAVSTVFAGVAGAALRHRLAGDSPSG